VNRKGYSTRYEGREVGTMTVTCHASNFTCNNLFLSRGNKKKAMEKERNRKKEKGSFPKYVERTHSGFLSQKLVVIESNDCFL
jgi:hypothetical protein